MHALQAPSTAEFLTHPLHLTLYSESPITYAKAIHYVSPSRRNIRTPREKGVLGSVYQVLHILLERDKRLTYDVNCVLKVVLFYSTQNISTSNSTFLLHFGIKTIAEET